MRKKGTNAKKKVLVEWIKSRSYEKLHSGDSMSKLINTLITAVLLSP